MCLWTTVEWVEGPIQSQTVGRRLQSHKTEVWLLSLNMVISNCSLSLRAESPQASDLYQWVQDCIGGLHHTQWADCERFLKSPSPVYTSSAWSQWKQMGLEIKGSKQLAGGAQKTKIGKDAPIWILTRIQTYLTDRVSDIRDRSMSDNCLFRFWQSLKR